MNPDNVGNGHNDESIASSMSSLSIKTENRPVPSNLPVQAAKDESPVRDPPLSLTNTDSVEMLHYQKEPQVPSVSQEDEDEDDWGPCPAPPGDMDIDRNWRLDFQPASIEKPAEPRPRICPSSPAGGNAVLRIDRDTPLDYRSVNEFQGPSSTAVPPILSNQSTAVPPISSGAVRVRPPPPESMAVDRDRPLGFRSANNTNSSQSPVVLPVRNTPPTYSVDQHPPVISKPEPNLFTNFRLVSSSASGSAQSSAVIDRNTPLEFRPAQHYEPQVPVVSMPNPKPSTWEGSAPSPASIDRDRPLEFHPVQSSGSPLPVIGMPDLRFSSGSSSGPSSAYIDRDRPLNFHPVSGNPSSSNAPPTPLINTSTYPPASAATWTSFANVYPSAVPGPQPSYYPAQPVASASGPQPNYYLSQPTPPVSGSAPYQPVGSAPGPQTNYYPSPPTPWTDPNAYRPGGPGSQPSYYPAPNVYQPANPASPASQGLQTNPNPSPPTQWAGPNGYPPTPNISNPYQTPPAPWVAYPPTAPPTSGGPYRPQPQAPPIPPIGSGAIPSTSTLAYVPSTQYKGRS